MSRTLPPLPGDPLSALLGGPGDPSMPGRGVPDAVSDGCLFCRPGAPDNELVPTVPEIGNGCYVRIDNYPAFAGHVEIVPYRHVERLTDLTAQEWAGMGELLRFVADEWFPEHCDTNAYNVGGNVGVPAGQSQPHAHLHVIPRRTGDVADPLGGIRAAFPNFAPRTW